FPAKKNTDDADAVLASALSVSALCSCESRFCPLMHYCQFSCRIHGYDRKTVSLSDNDALSIFCHITNTLISQIFDLQHNEFPPVNKYAVLLTL
ncbi:hypothetical protein, partial [uncultured Selenomonas sp.]|uniref:hypothetical protein n=1 Tax=uncultured Selenomonas sp. TaxID=159275 RepID=UPI0028DAF9C1